VVERGQRELQPRQVDETGVHWFARPDRPPRASGARFGLGMTPEAMDRGGDALISIKDPGGRLGEEGGMSHPPSDKQRKARRQAWLREAKARLDSMPEACEAPRPARPAMPGAPLIRLVAPAPPLIRKGAGAADNQPLGALPGLVIGLGDQGLGDGCPELQDGFGCPNLILCIGSEGTTQPNGYTAFILHAGQSEAKRG
jgi:hypothetical protein